MQCGFFAAQDSTGAYDPVLNVPAMQSEIMRRGPISCSLYHWLPKFSCYTAGVLQAALPANVSFDDTTHTVSLVGWGTEDGVPYWYNCPL